MQILSNDGAVVADYSRFLDMHPEALPIVKALVNRCIFTSELSESDVKMMKTKALQTLASTVASSTATHKRPFKLMKKQTEDGYFVEFGLRRLLLDNITDPYEQPVPFNELWRDMNILGLNLEFKLQAVSGRTLYFKSDQQTETLLEHKNSLAFVITGRYYDEVTLNWAAENSQGESFSWPIDVPLVVPKMIISASCLEACLKPTVKGLGKYFDGRVSPDDWIMLPDIPGLETEIFSGKPGSARFVWEDIQSAAGVI